MPLLALFWSLMAGQCGINGRKCPIKNSAISGVSAQNIPPVSLWSYSNIILVVGIVATCDLGLVLWEVALGKLIVAVILIGMAGAAAIGGNYEWREKKDILSCDSLRNWIVCGWLGCSAVHVCVSGYGLSSLCPIHQGCNCCVGACGASISVINDGGLLREMDSGPMVCDR